MDIKNLRMLYVEDDEQDIEIFSEILRATGFNDFSRLITANTIKEATGLINDTLPDIIFLDLNLPDSNRMDTYLQIKKLFPSLPIVVMTGLNDVQLSHQLVNKGAQDFLVKGGFDGNLLERVIWYSIGRNKLDKKIKISEQKHRILFEKAPDDIILLDKNLNILDCNISFQILLGYSREEIIGKHINEFTAIDDKDKSAEAFEKLTITSKIDVQLHLKRKDGDQVPVWRSINGLYDNENKLTGAIIQSKDITLRLKYEEQLKLQQEHIRLINKILRHDITNNLTAIKSHIKIFTKDSDMANITGIDNYVNKSLKLIRQMRELEYILDTNQDLKTYNLGNIFKNLIEKYSDIEFTVKGDCDVLADNAVDSVFDNLIGNAIKHGKTDRIEIAVYDQKKFCQVKIRDFGIGIPDDIKEDVFKENFIYGLSGGSGLGLYIVKTTIERYGGKITVEDNNPTGTVFILTFRKI